MRKPEREVKDADIDPGLEAMADLARMTSLSARKPPSNELADAWEKFFQAKKRKKEAVLDFQATLALQTFRYLQVAPHPDRTTPWIPVINLICALSALAILPKDVGEEHKMLARAVYDEVESRQSSRPAADPFLDSSLRSVVSVLSHTKASREAQELLQKQMAKDNAAASSNGKTPESSQRDRDANASKTWALIIEGYAREGDKAGILGAVDMMKQYGIPFDSHHQRPIVNFYAERDDVISTRYWYDHLLETWPLNAKKNGTQRRYRHPETSLTALRLCMRKQDKEWGRKIVQDAVEQENPGPQAWNAVFTWAAFMGKGVDEVDRMMTVMTERFPQIKPSTATINDLVGIAMERGDMYMAERFFNLGERRGIRSDASTYILQMRYRLSINDIEGARAAYQRLQSEEVEDNKDLPVINQLIQVMCTSKEYDFQSIIHIVEDINHRRLRFDVETVSALTILHLSRDELHDAIDLLQTHNFHFSIQQRALIRSALFDFCLDRNNSNTRAWDTYTILTQIFGETPRDERTTIMESFFSRRRPDMAIHAFNSMRTHTRPDTTATVDTYTAVLVGLAQSATTISLDPGALSSIIRADAGIADDEDAPDVEGFGEGGALGDNNNELETLLASVYSHIKLDASLPSPHPTRLLNALMIVYTALGQPTRALEFWRQVAGSREGPSWSSLHAAFRACERAPFGDEEARRIWRRLRRMDVEIGIDVWASYLSALVGNEDLDEAVEGLETFKTETGEEPGAFM